MANGLVVADALGKRALSASCHALNEHPLSGDTSRRGEGKDVLVLKWLLLSTTSSLEL